MRRTMFLAVCIGVLSAGLLPFAASGGSQTPAAQPAVPAYITADKLPLATPATCPYQTLIGKRVIDIDFAAYRPSTVRIVYPDTPLTGAYDAKRINIICDPKNNKVIDVRCG